MTLADNIINAYVLKTFVAYIFHIALIANSTITDLNLYKTKDSREKKKKTETDFGIKKMFIVITLSLLFSHQQHDKQRLRLCLTMIVHQHDQWPLNYQKS